MPDLPAPFLAIVGGLFGLLTGSFLNVCIVRLPLDESVVHPRSRCPRCGRMIEWYDNIPVVSWLLLRGKCRGCGVPISPMYPLVELANGLIWGWMAWRYGLSLETLRGALFGTLLLGIAMTDAREYIIPDEFSIGGLILGLAFSLAGGWPGFRAALIGAAVGFGLLWVFGAVGTWVGRRMGMLGGEGQPDEAMGGGDIKMMAMIGAFLGWPGVFVTVFLGALSGSLIYGPLNLSGRKLLVPFGVFLALGAAITYLAGGGLMNLYLRFIGAA
jgi:leader peptidase (prepilin peptidase)/N-methyltransferase